MLYDKENGKDKRMTNIIKAVPIYNFLNYCNACELEKKVLDCGAGGIVCRFPADLRLQYISLSVLKHFRRKGKLPVTFWHPV